MIIVAGQAGTVQFQEVRVIQGAPKISNKEN